MSTRKSARRHHGRHRQVDRSLPATAAEALAARRLGEHKALVPDPLARRALKHWKKAIDKPLFVYFIQAEDGPVKIGKAHDPVGRLRELQCGNPRDLFIRHVILATVELERYLHESWAPEAGVRGEWFGNGLEQVILSLAGEACQRQMQDTEKDYPVHLVAQWAEGILGPYRMKETMDLIEEAA